MMRRFGFVALVFILLVANGNLAFAREIVNDGQAMHQIESNVQDVAWLSQKFKVSQGWIYQELSKGYLLDDIYEGLLERQQGGSYEAFMHSRYAYAFDPKVRKKRNPILVIGVFSWKGYTPKSAERTFIGYVQQNVPKFMETKLYTQSRSFNNVKIHNPFGEFKRFGAGSHGGLSPHVHQPLRNVKPNGMIFGNAGKHTHNGGLSLPGRKDISQLYDYLHNGNMENSINRQV